MAQPSALEALLFWCCHSFIFVHAAGLAVIYLIALAGNQPTSSRPGSIEGRAGARPETRTEPSSTELGPVSFGQITAGGCSVAGIDCCSKLKTVPELCVQPAEMESERRQQQRQQQQPRLGPQV